MNESETDCKCGWVKLYHPRGALITLPVTVERLDYAAMVANVDAMLAAGFLVSAPGLEAGEERFDCSAVVRRQKSNANDRTTSDVIDLFEAGNKHKSLVVYLDTADEIAAFEFASKIRLADLQIFPGTAPPERCPQTESFFRSPGKPFGVICAPNPKYDPNETDNKKKKPKRLHVRWADERPAASPPAADGRPSTEPTDEKILAKWKAFTDTDPPIDVFNRFANDNYALAPAHLKQRIHAGIRAHASAAQWIWSDDDNCYVKQGRSTAGSKR